MDGFCNTSFWNSTSSWNTELPSVSPCFRHTVLIWLPCSVAWCLALFEGWSLCQRSNHASPFSGLYISKLVFLALTFAVCTTKLVVSSLLYLQHETDLAEVAGASIVLCTLVLVMAMTMWARWKGLRSSVVVPTFWLIFACCAAVACYADIVDFNYNEQNIGVFCNFFLVPLTVVQLVLSSLSEKPPDYTALDADWHYCVLKEWTIIPRVFFAYMWRIVLLGYHEKLDVTTLLQLCNDLKCATVFKAFHRAAFKKPQQLRTLVDEHGSAVRTSLPRAKQPSLYWVVFRVCSFHLLASTVLETVGVFISFVPPLMLSLILSFVQSNEYAWHGYIYAFGYAGFLFLSGVLDAHAVYFTEFAAFRAQSSLVAALYRKVFRLAPSARRQYMAGDVMNLMSVDVEEVSTFLTLSTQVWTVPLRIAITIWLLWRYLGASCLATVGVMFIAVLATTYVATLCDRFQEKQMALKDKRLRQISEILNGIKVLKLSGWEIPFMERVQQTRLQEVSYLKKFSLLDSVFGFLWTCAPYLAALASFGTYLAVNPSKRLTPEIAFVSLSLFSLMRFPMGILPDVISKFIRFLVSMGRLAKFLNEAELDLEAVGGNPEQGDSVTLKNATLSWSRQESPVLKNISLNFKTGRLVAVVGSVGSGKSSLLSAILGTLEKISGSVDVQGRIAYVPQQCWIQNATVKGNVVFTNPLDEDRYQQVIEGCALLPDLEMLPGGENTEIGEKGINLSGGQKLRLSLARAVYHNADVYLLDDPFSAVDVHVAAHLFEHVVGPAGILNSKTRILVTHTVTYLPQMDWIVLLHQGVVQEQGTYEDLVAREGSEFAAFLQQHVKAHPSTNSLSAAASGNGSKDKQADQSTGRSAADKCNLTEEETLCTGYVGRRVYGAYFKKVGWHFLIPAFIACCLTFGSEYGSAAWLSKWSQDADASRKHFYLIGYGLFLISYVVFNFVFWIIFVVGTLRAAVWFHNQLLHSIMRSPLSFFDTTPMGRIINRFSRDIESVDKEVPINANLTMCNIVWGMQLLILICIMSPYFTIVVIIAVCLFASITIVSLPAFRHVQRLRSVTRSPILSHISESIAGVVSVRAFGVTKQFINTLERHVDNNINCCYHSMALDCCRLVIANTMALVVSLGASLLTVAGRGSLSPGMVGLVLSYTLEVSNAASYTFRMFALLETSLVAVERIKEYIGLAEEAPWRNTETQPAVEWPSRGDVTYANYSAAYRDDLEMVLKEINIKAYDGQKIGLVGRTGAGKSTLALALFRIIEPKTGTIDVDNVDITKIGLHDLRSKMTIIPQDPVLFAGTLRWNLDPCSEYSDDAVWQALEQAHLKDFVATQDAGLDYEVLEGGENLSAGQKQLVCLTRALLRKSKVLVLDEATSSVDLATDHLVKETIHREFKDTTVITIAHRLHTIMDCDRILVLSAGEIVEEGSPSELLQKEDGLFLAMARDAGLA